MRWSATRSPTAWCRSWSGNWARERLAGSLDRAMCGIIGYTGSRPCQEILMAGLERLESRGYDSAGLSMVENGGISSIRAVGNLSALKERINGTRNGSAVTGIGHTRWATH